MQVSAADYEIFDEKGAPVKGHDGMHSRVGLEFLARLDDVEEEEAEEGAPSWDVRSVHSQPCPLCSSP